MASQALSECFSALDGGDYAAAQEHAFTALEKEPQSEAAQFHLALSFFLQKKYRKAERLFSKIRATKDLEVDILYYRGLSEYQLRKFSDASEHLEQCVALKSNDASAWDALGSCYLQLVRFGRACACSSV